MPAARRILIAVALVAAAVVALACSGGGDDDGDDTPRPAETNTVSTVEPVERRTETPGPSGDRPTSTPAPPLGLNTFHYTVELAFNVVAPGDPQAAAISGGIFGDFEAPDSHAFAQQYTVNGISATESYVLIGDDAWYREGEDGEWEQFARDDPEIQESLALTSADPDFLGTDEEFIDGIALFENELETIDDRLTHRYEFTQEDVAMLSGLLEDDLLGGTPLEGAENFLLRVWLDDLTGTLRRAELNATLAASALADAPFEVPAGSDVEFRLRIDVTRPDDPTITIEPPI
jgi:hypothetical protein